MGREVRRVPAGWEHPRDSKGHYRPLLDRTFDEAIEDWFESRRKWNDGGRQEAVENYGEEADVPFEEYDGPPPQPEDFRPRFDKADHVQMYENVSEGTPVSPVFATKGELVEWLVSQGHSRSASEQFVESGYAPSMVFFGGRCFMGVDSYDVPAGK